MFSNIFYYFWQINILNICDFDAFPKWHLSYTGMQMQNDSIWCIQMCENMSTARIERSKLSSECTVRRYRIRMMHMRLAHECVWRIRLRRIGCAAFVPFLCRLCPVSVPDLAPKNPKTPKTRTLKLNRYILAWTRGILPRWMHTVLHFFVFGICFEPALIWWYYSVPARAWTWVESGPWHPGHIQIRPAIETILVHCAKIRLFLSHLCVEILVCSQHWTLYGAIIVNYYYYY